MLQIIYQGVLETKRDRPWERERDAPVFFSLAIPIISVLENLKTIKINMEVMNLKSLSNFLVLCYGTNVIGDLEFILLYDYSQSR